MKKQPASKSYFFEGGYRDIARVMKTTWSKAFMPVKNEAARVGSIFRSNFVAGLFTLICDLVVFSVITAVILAANLAFSAVFLVSFFVLGIVVYVLYSLVYILDMGFCIIHKIASHCRSCQRKFSLPYYECPKCKTLHTNLRPGVYGILKRKCNCGAKIPTTFFNGRQKLNAVCPYCHSGITDGGRHSEIMIPVVGGPSSGKTCFIGQAISEIGKKASSLSLDYKYCAAADDEYADIRNDMDHGNLPQKTSDTRLKYYQFYLTPKGQNVKNLISICDVAGETYDDNDEIGRQIGYKFANAFIMLIDPLSITKYREELRSKKIPYAKYNPSNKSMDDILNTLIGTLENMNCLNSKNSFKTDVVVVFTKCDIPGLEEKIGDTALRRFRQEKNIASVYDAKNQLCEQFLLEYEERNFLNSLKSKFRSIQFFTSSSLGHVQNGASFTPQGVAEPMLWIIDKVSTSINLKGIWGTKI